MPRLNLMMCMKLIVRPISMILIVATLLLAGCGELDLAMGPLLSTVSFSGAQITPNADGDNDVVEIQYSLRRPAAVSIYFDDSAGERYYFREARRRAPGDYSVFWGGVVDQPQLLSLIHI